MQRPELVETFKVQHINHIANIETGVRHFPIKQIDAIIEKFEQKKNRDYIRFCAFHSKEYFQFHTTDVPTPITKLMALHYAGLLNLELIDALNTVIEPYVPDLPDDYERRFQQSANYGRQKS